MGLTSHCSFQFTDRFQHQFDEVVPEVTGAAHDDVSLAEELSIPQHLHHHFPRAVVLWTNRVGDKGNAGTQHLTCQVLALC